MTQLIEEILPTVSVSGPRNKRNDMRVLYVEFGSIYDVI